MEHRDTVAEIQNTLRAEMEVKLGDIEIAVAQHLQRTRLIGQVAHATKGKAARLTSLSMS